MNKEISIIIPNFNGEKYIENCLMSLQGQSINNFEIIVVDDCSTDRSLEILKRHCEIMLIENSENSGFAVSVNNGIKKASGKFIILLNNDVVVEKDFVEQLWKAIVKNSNIFSVSSKMIRYYERDKIDDTGDFYTILGWAYKRGDGKSMNLLKRSTRVFSTCAGAGIYRKSVFDEIGFFDEKYFAYMEDVDISYRGLIHGYQNWYEPRAICYHIGSATTAEGNKYSAFKVAISSRNNIYTAYKNMPLFQLMLNSPFLFCGFLIKGVMFQFKGYGKEYCSGIKDGFKGLKTISKTPFKIKNFMNYIKIEGMLLANVLRYIKEKIV